MGLRLRQILLALVLSLAILGAIMASSSPTNLALGATTTCGINGCVSTPSIVSSTSYSYLGTTISITSTTSTKFSTSISSSTTTTSATTTSTFFSYTSTISTSITTTSYSTQITGTQTSTNTNWVTVPTTTTTSSTYTNVVTKQGTSVSCPVALVTAGNWLEPYANFLRNFRNNEIQNTTAGRAFMLTFNNWYYFWAPSLSNSAASNPWIFKAVQGGVYPLIGILYASYYSYTLIAPLSPEAAAITAGVVASSLIGSLFVAPIAYATLRLTRREGRLRISRMTAGPSVAWLMASVAMCAIAYATNSSQLLALGTSSMVLSMLGLGSLIGTRALAYVQLPFATYASKVFAFKRVAKILL